MASVQEALAKISQTSVPQVNKVALAYSGGLDSALSVHLLRNKYMAKEIIAINVDVGQGEEEIEEGLRKAKVLGLDVITIDVKKEFTEEWLTKAIRANSDYLGYPVSTSMTRQLIASVVAKKAVELGCDALCEGSSGKGNDQYRMHNVFKIFAPKLEVIVPVRDFDLTRLEEEELCKAWGVPVTETITGGDDKTMWCRSIASGGIGLDTKLPDDIWMWFVPPQKAPNSPTTVEITYEGGIPVGLNGEPATLPEIVQYLNEVGGLNSIGKIDMFEDGIMDLKSREIYEAPGATILIRVHKDMEQFTLTKDEVQFKKMIDQKWAYMVYHGEWFHPLKSNLDAFIAKSQETVNATYKVELYKGNIDIVERKSAASLFMPEIRAIQSSSFNQQLCGPAAQIRGLPFEILAKRKSNMEKAGETVHAEAVAQGLRTR